MFSRTDVTPPDSPSYAGSETMTTHIVYNLRSNPRRNPNYPTEESTRLTPDLSEISDASELNNVHNKIIHISDKLAALQKKRMVCLRKKRDARNKRGGVIRCEGVIRKAEEMLEEGKRMVRDGVQFIKAGEAIWREGDSKVEKALKILGRVEAGVVGGDCGCEEEEEIGEVVVVEG